MTTTAPFARFFAAAAAMALSALLVLTAVGPVNFPASQPTLARIA